MNRVTAAYKRAVDVSNREQLILENLDYVRKIFSTMAVHVADEDERENLYSAGIVGLVQAADNFDSSRGITFKTFAYRRIRGAIIDELRKIAPVSQEVLVQIGLIKKAYQRLEPPVTPELLAQETGYNLIFFRHFFIKKKTIL